MKTIRNLLGIVCICAFLIVTWVVLPNLRQKADADNYEQFRQLGLQAENEIPESFFGERNFFLEGPSVIDLGNPTTWFGKRIPEWAYIGIAIDRYEEEGQSYGDVYILLRWDRHHHPVREEFVVRWCDDRQIKRVMAQSVPELGDQSLSNSELHQLVSSRLRELEWEPMTFVDERLFCGDE